MSLSASRWEANDAFSKLVATLMRSVRSETKRKKDDSFAEYVRGSFKARIKGNIINQCPKQELRFTQGSKHT